MYLRRAQLTASYPYGNKPCAEGVLWWRLLRAILPVTPLTGLFFDEQVLRAPTK